MAMSRKEMERQHPVQIAATEGSTNRLCGRMMQITRIFKENLSADLLAS
jgi:hypothetical protein